MRKVKCPVCFSSETEIELVYKLKSGSVDYFRCKTCSLIFLSKNIYANYNKEYYLRGEKKGIIRSLENVYVYLSNSYKKSITEEGLTKKYKIRILDIGCGRGHFLKTLSNKYIKEGVELNRSKNDYSDIKMHYSSINDLKLKNGSYDVITLWHVLEHLDDPKSSFKVINKLLKDNGRLIFSTPNTQSLGYKLAGDRWYHFDFPYHLGLHNKKSIYNLAESSGFKIEKFIRHPFEFPLDLFWSILKSKKGFKFIPVYPIAKLLDDETLVCIFKKK